MSLVEKGVELGRLENSIEPGVCACGVKPDLVFGEGEVVDGAVFLQ